MYVGAILMYLATPLILGSLLALAVSCVMIALFVWRTAREDETLRQELPGYLEYAGRTRFRLAPGVW
jgi:protein-S-isoprenylcysteine O-methyltransferase Ste14